MATETRNGIEYEVIEGGLGTIIRGNRLAGNPVALASGTGLGVQSPKIIVRNGEGEIFEGNIVDDETLHAEIAGLRLTYAAACGAGGTSVLDAAPEPAPDPEPEPTPDPVPEPEPAPDPLEARVAAIERRLDAMAAALAGD
jgi:hypothetical protein